MPRLGSAAFEPGQCFNLGGSGGDRRGRLYAKVLFQGRPLVTQCAFLAGKVQRLEAFQAAFLMLVQITVERGFGDATDMLNLLVRHSLTAQEHDFHLQLHKWMRVVKAPIAQSFYSFRAPLQLEHLRTSWSKLILQLNFYQRFSKVSSCPARSISPCPHSRMRGPGDQRPWRGRGLPPAHEPARDTTNARKQARYREASDKRSNPRGVEWQS